MIKSCHGYDLIKKNERHIEKETVITIILINVKPYLLLSWNTLYHQSINLTIFIIFQNRVLLLSETMVLSIAQFFII